MITGAGSGRDSQSLLDCAIMCSMRTAGSLMRGVAEMAVQLRAYVDGGSVSFPKRDLSKELPFGMWTVVSFAGRDAKSVAYWNCRCACGSVCVVQQSNLLSRRSGGCGCTKPQAVADAHTTHGGTHTAEYHIWSGMKARCLNADARDYHRYGGRGITVCSEWIESFPTFLRDMGLRPSQKHSIERKKNELGYSPANCKWATVKEQANNRRSNKPLAYKGEVLNLSEWAERIGITVYTLWARLCRGWSAADAIETPCGGKRKRQIG